MTPPCASRDGLRDALRSFADISTVHITPDTADLLDRTPVEDWPVGGYRGPYGYMLYVADELMEDAPDDLRKLFDALRGRVDYVLIDRDASQLDELPDYAEASGRSRKAASRCNHPRLPRLKGEQLGYQPSRHHRNRQRSPAIGA